ncbi:MAG: putative Na+/H+ antiporter [Vicinamibacterales bacterium]
MSTDFPLPLEAYGPPSAEGLLATLAARVALDPFNAVATGLFVLAVLHTFVAPQFARRAHERQHRLDEESRRCGRACTPDLVAEALHFLGEVEVVFGLWAVVLIAVATAFHGWHAVVHYVNDTVVYTEALFVVVIMAMASTRPVIALAEGALGRAASIGRATPLAWWFTILSIGPLLGSFITEPAAMTICALLLSRQFFDLEPSEPLKYATLGLLFVNVSIGGTLTHFAAPPVLMVARPWGWDTLYMLQHFGWRAVAAILISTVVTYVRFRRELVELGRRRSPVDLEQPDEDVASGEPALLPLPAWLIAVHVFFVVWTVVNAHYPALFLGGFLFFLGFMRATTAYQSRLSLRAPLLVGFFLGGLVIHGGLQGWWIAPTLASLSETPLFFGATLLTAVNDNALITYLATLVPNFSEPLRMAVVEGAVTGGGLTVIANAPNPAGQALLARFFGGAVSPVQLLAGALVPTIVAAIAFRLF